MYVPIYTKIAEFNEESIEIPKPVPLETNQPIMVIDNFYTNVNEVREFIVKENFSENVSVKSYLNDEIKKTFEKFLNKNILEISGGHYEILTSLKQQSVCVDSQYNWVGVLFMSQFSPYESGIKTYMFKDGTVDKKDMKIKNNQKTLEGYKYDFMKWSQIDKIGCKYNRLVFIQSNLFYSIDHFGTSIVDGNLVQLFNFLTD